MGYKTISQERKERNYDHDERPADTLRVGESGWALPWEVIWDDGKVVRVPFYVGVTPDKQGTQCLKITRTGMTEFECDITWVPNAERFRNWPYGPRVKVSDD